jgi:hypothetical protein
MLEKITFITVKKWLFITLTLLSTWLLMKP